MLEKIGKGKQCRMEKPMKQSSEGVKKSKMKEVINLWLSNNLHNTIEIHEHFEVHLSAWPMKLCSKGIKKICHNIPNIY
jgi:hypothetical protein